MTEVAVVFPSSGNTMPKKTRGGLAPSRSAASSMETGTPVRKPWYKKTLIASPKPPYITTSPGKFFSPIPSKSESSGYITAWNGMSIAAVNA